MKIPLILSEKDWLLMTDKKKIDPYMNYKSYVDCLMKEWDEHGNLCVAFDFDNTVFDYHGKGFLFPVIDFLLKECKKEGFKLILFTAKETKEELNQCVDYCKERGYEPDFINMSPVMNTKKPYYNILLDDRAGLDSAAMVLSFVLARIQSKRKQNEQQ